MGDEPSTQQVPASPRFGILGPLQVSDAGHRPLPLGGPRARELLALLLLNPNRPLSSDYLVTAMWGESPSDGAATTLRTHVGAVRRVLASAGAGEALGTSPGGYRLALDRADLDAEVFAGLVDRGQEALGIGDPAHAAALLGEALALWRGDVLSDLGPPDFAEAAVARLGELRVVAEETAMAAALALGQHREVVGHLQELVAAHPFHERLCGQLMLALYRSGRQVDALSVYAETRQRLGEELGLDPGPDLQALETAVLRQDPALLLSVDATAPVTEVGPRPPRQGQPSPDNPPTPCSRRSGGPPWSAGTTGSRRRRPPGRTPATVVADWSRWAGPQGWASRDWRPSWPTSRPGTAPPCSSDAATRPCRTPPWPRPSPAAPPPASSPPVHLPACARGCTRFCRSSPTTQIVPDRGRGPRTARGPRRAPSSGCSPAWRRRPRCSWSSRTPSG